jgi:tetratricopeptide (TPR) repeat protein
MNSPTVSYFSKRLLTIVFIASLLVMPALVRAQEDYTEEDYKIYQDVQAEKDMSKKVDMIVSFLKEKPKNSLRKNMIPEYQKLIVELKNEKKWAQIITFGEKFLGAVPGDDFTENALAAAYSETGNWRGFAAYGEKAYASKPSAGLAMEIAKAYQKLGNNEKYLQWRERVLTSDPNNIEILADMTKKYMASQNTTQAAAYAKKCLSAIPSAKKPAGVDDKDWKSTVDQTYAIAYSTLGGIAYQNKRYSEAIQNLDQSVKYFKRNDTAYLILGMSYWSLRKMDFAMLNFAKAYVIKGAASSQAKQQLDTIYKNTHRNSLAGIEKIIERAQQDLK